MKIPEYMMYLRLSINIKMNSDSATVTGYTFHFHAAQGHKFSKPKSYIYENVPLKCV